VNDIDQIYEILLGQDFQSELFGDLKKLKKTNSGYIACCPFHDDKTPSFSIDDEKPVWHCFAGCGNGNWIDYLTRKEGWSFREALEHLATAANYTLNTTTTPLSQLDSQQKIIETVLEEAQNFFIHLLHNSNKADKVRQYISKRGYTPEIQSKMYIGYYPSQEVVKSHLIQKGFSNEAIQQSGLFTTGFGTTHTITIPYRDSLGRMKGFILRSIDEKTTPKYKFSSGTEKDTVFNAHKAKSSQQSIIIVEGFLDCLYASAEGYDSLVGLGQTTITDKQVEFFQKREQISIIIALDDDDAGKKGTIATAEKLLPHNKKIYVLDSFHGHKDPDEYIRAFGIESFKKLLNTVLPYPLWKTKQLAEPLEQASSAIQRDIIKHSLFTHYLTVTDSVYASQIRNQLITIFQIDNIQFDKEIENLRIITNRQQAQTIYKKALTKGKDLLENNSLEELQEHLQSITSLIRDTYISPLPEPYTLSSFKKDLSETVTGLQTGYKELDEYITLKPGTISIIAGRPRHGKTTFMFNLILNLIRNNEKKCFIFFTYEESRKDITLKILTNISEETISKRQNINNIENYLHGNNHSRPKINMAFETIGNLLNTGRLQIYDSSHTADELSTIISTLCKNNSSIGAIFIDYIQKVKIAGKYQSRQIELQKISERLLECAKNNNVPIILGAQLNREATSKSRPRLENLRESGDIENDANTVLALYNESVEQQEDTATQQQESEKIELEIHILKNRNGVSNKSITLMFNRPILKISDK
jgi:DNA primase catalytic core